MSDQVEQTIQSVFPDWKPIQLIGRGSFGEVWVIERDVFGQKERAALKIITIPQSESEVDELRGEGYTEKDITTRFQGYLEDIVREYSMMAQMKGCANIVYCDDVKYIQHDDAMGWDIFIKMELLTPLIRAIDRDAGETQAVRVGLDLANALAFCEKRNVLHRDIKPQNIFVSSDGTYKLGDFGIAKTAERTTGGTKTGTFKYMAPEVYNNQPYGAKADIYSLGLVLYWLLNERRTPFLPLPPGVPTATEEERARARRVGGEAVPTPAHGSAELRRIVLKACAFAPRERYQNAEELLRDLEALPSVRPAPPVAAAEPVRRTPPDTPAQDAPEAVGTVGLFGDRDETTVRQVSAQPDEDATERARPEPAPAPKKQGKGKLIGIIAACIAVALIGGIALGGGFGKKASGAAKPKTPTASESQMSAKETGTPATETASQADQPAESTEPPFPDMGETFPSLLWGQYEYDTYRFIAYKNGDGGYYEHDLDAFIADMSFENAAGLEVSSVPYYFRCARMIDIGPDYDLHVADKLNTSDKYASWGTQKEKEECYAKFVEAYGDTYLENYKKLLNLDYMELRYADRKAHFQELYATYEVEGNRLRLAFITAVDPVTFAYTTTDWHDLDFYFNGKNLVLRRNGSTVELVPNGYGANTLAERGHYWYNFDGCVADNSQAYHGIYHILYNQGMDRWVVKFADGGSAVSPKGSISGNNELTITWEKVERPYNGHYAEFDEPGELRAEYIDTGIQGGLSDPFILKIDGCYYCYQSSQYAYNEYFLLKMAEILDEDVDIGSIAKSQAKVLQETATTILEDLGDAFTSAGVEANIDQTTGKVTMDSSILFGYNDDALSDVGKAYLDGFFDVYASVVAGEKYARAISKIVIEGHTDTDGGHDYNQKLSERRAQSVADYCLSKQPGLAGFIESKGCAYDNPVLDSEGKIDMAASRRVVFKFILTV